MRLLIRLRAQDTFPYQMDYHRHFQGFIYSLLRDTSYHSLHDKARYKFFCFSNLIPPSRVIPRGSDKTLIVSSPDDGFIQTIEERLFQRQGATARLGGMSFTISAIRSQRISLTSSPLEEITLTTGTPIIVRIPSYRLKEYDIKPKRDYRFVYWRSEYTPTAFIKQLEENLLKKYCEYFSAEEQPGLQLFEKLKFRKQVAVPLRMEKEESTVIGTLWDFDFGPIDSLKREIIRFGLDAGFGEMNSLGFGFMNIREPGTIKS